MLDSYSDWLDRQALAPRTRSPHRRWVAELYEHVDAGDELYGFLATTIAAPYSATGAEGWSIVGSRSRR